MNLVIEFLSNPLLESIVALVTVLLGAVWAVLTFWVGMFFSHAEKKLGKGLSHFFYSLSVVAILMLLITVGDYLVLPYWILNLLKVMRLGAMFISVISTHNFILYIKSYRTKGNR